MQQTIAPYGDVVDLMTLVQILHERLRSTTSPLHTLMIRGWSAHSGTCVP